MKGYKQFADSVIIGGKGTRAKLHGYDSSLTFIGAGRSAFVFKLPNENKALKVFFPSFTHIAKEEAEIYRTLQGIEYYPNLYEAGENFLVIDYIEGSTLFDCVSTGIFITDQHIAEIDKALMHAKERGLNPSDIHLRNIFINDRGEIKMIDVARFRQTKNCSQWDDLKTAFHKYYRKTYFPKKIPAAMMNFIAALYKKKLIPLPS
ncbi:protein kinase family protein [Metabacillus idriensis]|uniref:Protein kinase family protein n=1 Tax=Metabacillus idriensis TaxID=324768 RepID=A0A6I2MD90_9BACI|nr:serine/threonine protein kinase [Metabacillus idriensis]MCM3597819.1 protein kinase family protein [Metabacillus idriensis]MRX56305.1 protein kinase family protein [Metabacillus idriensis]OHR70447.1 serine/threonine protein kinase [Bacillus sp. HMSC76G11]